ncbi:MAG: non-canonical purine NTP pyrophosphatase [Gemmatimonadaceae bacterium]|nr:non-canonical purine NTP pyrophosphatase [Gemmatimonadaceae bacterium]
MKPRGRLLLATRSAGKRRELEPMLRAHGWDVVDLDGAGLRERSEEEDALEIAETFEENALAKARHFYALSGLPTMADDSGLSCAALGGAPGVFSRRWSARAELDGAALDAANNQMLLSALAGAALSAEVRRAVPTRAARFVCAAAFVYGDREVVARGETQGWILEREVGTGGFGYDPLFYSDDLGAPFGMVTREEKARVSHRARAVEALLRKVDEGS